MSSQGHGAASPILAVSDGLVALINDLGVAASTNPREFPTELARILRRVLDLEACSVLTNCPEAGILKLKAVAGFDVSRYQDFQVPYESLAGRATERRDKWTSHAAPFDDRLFRDKGLLEGKEIRHAVFVPFGVHLHDGELLPLGVICLYVSSSDYEHASQIGAFASRLAPHIGRLYETAHQSHMSELRQELLQAAAFTGDAGTLAHRFRQTLVGHVPTEACSVWLLDPAKDLIRLYSTSGLKSRYSRIPDRDHTIRLADSGPLRDAVARGDVRRHASTHPRFDPAKVLEDAPHPLTNGLIWPITIPSSQVKRKGQPLRHVGVVTMINRRTTLEDRSMLTDFTWEDELTVAFACEMLAVLTYQQLRTRDYQSDFERKMHGARVNLQSARDHLLTLERHVNLAEALPPTYGNYVSNAIEWIEDLHTQVNREELISPDALPVQSVALFGDVIAPVMSLMMRRAKALGIYEFEIKNQDRIAENFRSIPFVQGNATALVTVLRNLADNAFKYRSEDDPPWMSFSVDWTARNVVLRVEDNGIGIPRPEMPLVFEQGFRGAAASAVAPQGYGLGLYDCKRLMSKMGGEIAVAPGSDGSGVQFTLTLPREGRARRSAQKGSL